MATEKVEESMVKGSVPIVLKQLKRKSNE